jgi:iron complex transport system ATP-binding protein
MAIHVHNLFFSYSKTPLLQDVSLHARQGSFTVLLGKNGSGKSTLLRLIAGLLVPSHGEINILGKNLSHLSFAQRARCIGYLPQFHNPVFPFTVEEVVLTGRASYVFSMPHKTDMDMVDEAIQRVGITELRKRPYNELSGGERQMVMIARVLAQDPRIILLDEPLSHLDLSNQARLLQLINKLVASDLTVLAVLHDPNAAFLYADHWIFLKNGKVREPAQGTLPWDADLLSDVYETPIESIPYQDRSLIVPLTRRDK